MPQPNPQDFDKELRALLEPYTDAYFNANDASTTASEYRQSAKWRREGLDDVVSQVKAAISQVLGEDENPYPHLPGVPEWELKEFKLRNEQRQSLRTAFGLEANHD